MKEYKKLRLFIWEDLGELGNFEDSPDVMVERLQFGPEGEFRRFHFDTFCLWRDGKITSDFRYLPKDIS